MTDDTYRKIQELALETARSRQSAETKFVHYHTLAEENGRSDTIPIYENFLFVLALLKSHKTEQVLEAKVLLERLFYYQNKSDDSGYGNFPIYLHESPICYNRWEGVKVLAPLYWIVHHYHQVLGEALRVKSKQCLLNLCFYCLKTLKENAADYGITLKIATGIYATGMLFAESELEEKGSRLLDDLLQMGPQPVWYSRQGISEILVCLQMVYSKISESPWHSFWLHVEKTWNPELRTYCGPMLDEMQSGYEPEITFYDCFLCVFSKTLNPKLCQKKFVQLQSVLIQPSDDCVNAAAEIETQGKIADTQWFMKSTAKYAYSVIEQIYKLDTPLQKGFHPFYLQWKNNDNHYSLVCSGGRFSEIKFAEKNGFIQLYFTLPDEIENDHPLENRELLFYCSAHEDVKYAVENSLATTFKLGEAVQIQANCELSLTFELIEGDGAFVGHLMPGNRPSQQLITKRAINHAYDRQIFLRTLRKKQSCTLRVSIKMQF